MNKLIDYKSLEKYILLDIFKSIPMMDNWIASIIENYIYKHEEEWYIEPLSLKSRYLTRFGVKHGEYKEWYCKTDDLSNIGQLSILTTYVNGKEHGEYKNWWDNGQIHCQTTYINGERHGNFTTWFPYGTLSAQATFIHGKPNGECKRWNVYGEVIECSNYIDGIEVSK